MVINDLRIRKRKKYGKMDPFERFYFHHRNRPLFSAAYAKHLGNTKGYRRLLYKITIQDWRKHPARTHHSRLED